MVNYCHLERKKCKVLKFHANNSSLKYALSPSNHCSFVIKQALGLIRGNTVTVLHARGLQLNTPLKSLERGTIKLWNLPSFSKHKI